MREKIQIVLAAAGLLAIGMALGFWLALRRPLPPPGWMGGPPPPEEGGRPHPTPAQVDRFHQRLQEIEPEVTAFQERFTAIDNDFRSRFVALLTDAQRARHPDHRAMPIDWVGDFDRMAAGRFGMPPGGHPHEGRALFALLRILMYEPSLRIATDRYELTPDQQIQLRALFEERRKAVLALMDAHPLPLDRLFFLMRDLGMFHEGAERRPGPPSDRP